MKENNKKNSSITKIVLWVIITNLVTVSLLLFFPIPIFGMKLVSNSDYNFLLDYRKLVRVHNILEKKYVDEITPEKEEKMLEGAINGMANSLGDPYTTYMNKKDYESFITQTSGSYAGVGILLTVKDEKLVVVEPIEGGPALKAGVKSGDIITKVDGTSVSGKDNTKAVEMMKGDEGTEVTITVDRSGVGAKNIKIKREIIQMKTVKGQIVDGIGYVRISSFDEITGKEFEKEVDSLKAKGIKGLILDLRENPGGILDESIKVLDVLLDEKVVLSTVDNGGRKTEYKTNKGKVDVPIAVLVNKGSASASEIVSGAIKDLNAGTLIGTTTYGKGLVQATKDLQDNTALKFTIARYYTPSGISIQGKGIEPNIVVELPKDKRITSLSDDPQFKKAFEVVKSKIQ
ncbi:S41 family peptidase [Clostridium cylindrosporum]|uniref:Carboxy-terminal-processing protease CtpA n=1 Tax=Clostridium cylindrosporum DSM 605 TaxID=1121307 RepID=A0A0J8FZX5_CLOCY|nr:S41 family peptidase [Clostridium cylindrosporum]KMT21106.1 carboxy-terminal-processing protease CtpA [Clostridium cylindrosporum DSM 605]